MASDGSTASPLERRVRRLIGLVMLLAVLAAVFGILPNGADLLDHSFKHDTDTWTGRTTSAGGWSLAGWAVVLLFAGSWAREQPSRGSGIAWIIASVVIDIAAGVAWVMEHFTLDTWRLRWPGHLTAACAGSTLVLVFVALPIVLVTSSQKPPAPVPSARVVSDPAPPAAS